MTKLKPCPFDEDGSRKYYMLAGGRIELQSKGDGSTQRILANKQRWISHIYDSCLEDMANNMHKSIEDYADEKVKQASNWNYDMDAAPKDGTVVLLYMPEECEKLQSAIFYTSINCWQTTSLNHIPEFGTEPTAWKHIELPTEGETWDDARAKITSCTQEDIDLILESLNAVPKANPRMVEAHSLAKRLFAKPTEGE